jgi:transcription termination factor NusB
VLDGGIITMNMNNLSQRKIKSEILFQNGYEYDGNPPMKHSIHSLIEHYGIQSEEDKEYSTSEDDLYNYIVETLNDLNKEIDNILNPIYNQCEKEIDRILNNQK